MPYEKVKSDRANELNIPQESWDLLKSFLDELDRILTYRSIDVVQAPINNIVGSATLLSGRYLVITSLSANDAGSIRLGMSSGSDGLHEVDETLEFIKLYIIKNSHGVLTDSIDVVNAIDALCITKNTHDKFISCAQDISCLIQHYRKTLFENHKYTS